jgi:3-phenylpropionate/trans-cinnamate dioxygenase ferredoxin subunit
MSTWHNIAKAIDILPGAWQEVDFDNVSILVCNIDFNFYAIENMCTHDGGPLSDGCLVGDEIMCSRHGARFCVKTGEVTAAPAYENLNTFPVRVENGVVQVQLES